MESNDRAQFEGRFSLRAVSNEGSPSIGTSDLPRRPERCQNRPRVALYSHDTVGLGHFRRNLAIAEALAASPLEPHILLITGSMIARSFDLPVRTDCITLPSFEKNPLGACRLSLLWANAPRKWAPAPTTPSTAPRTLHEETLHEEICCLVVRLQPCF